MEDDPYDFAPAPKGGGGSSGGSKGSKSKKSSRSSEQQQAPAPQPQSESKPKPAKAPIPIKPQPSPKPAAAADDDDDGYGDDFEDYQEDFEPAEADDEAPPSAPKAAAAAYAPNQAKISASNARELPASETKSTSSSGGGEEAAPSRESKKSSAPDARTNKKAALSKLNFTLSLPTSTNTLKSKRLHRLLQACVMDLQLEKTVTTLHIAPSSLMDVYSRALRSQPASIRQIGCPNDDDNRSMEVQTDERATQDKGVQFCYGDDTEFLGVLSEVAARQGGRVGTTFDSNSSGGSSRGSSSSAGANSTRLSSFLHAAAPVCEKLILERISGNSGTNSSSSNSKSGLNSSLFGPSGWVTLGTDKASGGNELLRTRSAISLSFSPLEPSLLLVVHPLPSADREGDDLRPSKGFVSVWNINFPGAPLHVLQCPGDPCLSAFSSSQPNLVIAGSNEGCIYLWDLSETPDAHRDQDSHDLGIHSGIRKPSYSNAHERDGATAGVGEGMAGDYGGSTHTAPITKIESLGGGRSSTSSSTNTHTISQWVTLDLLGTLCFWLTTNVNTSTNSDSASINTSSKSGSTNTTTNGSSPWSRIGLLCTKSVRGNIFSPSLGLSLSTNANASSSGNSNTSSTSSISVRGGGGSRFNRLMAAIPGDPASFLLSCDKGGVERVQRFSSNTNSGNANTNNRANNNASANASAKGVFTRKVDRLVVTASTNTNTNINTIDYYADVSSISVGERVSVSATAATGVTSNTNETSQDSTSTSTCQANASVQLFLAGRRDGSIDLFELGGGLVLGSVLPVNTYTIPDDGSSSSSSGGGGGSGVGRGGRGQSREAGLGLGLGLGLEVVFVSWLPGRGSAFMAVTKTGCCYIYDILVDSAPLCVDLLPTSTLASTSTSTSTNANASASAVALSLPQPVVKRSSLAVITSANTNTSSESGIGVQVRGLWEGWHLPVKTKMNLLQVLEGLAFVSSNISLDTASPGNASVSGNSSAQADEGKHERK